MATATIPHRRPLPSPLRAEIDRYPMLDAAEILALARRVKAGTDPETGTLTPDATAARDAIVCANLRMAVRFARHRRPPALDYPEAVSAALEGLIEAAGRYDPDRLTAKGQPHKFATLAFWWMRSRVGAAAERAHLVHVPKDLLADIARVRALARAGQFPADATPSPAWVAGVLGCAPGHAASVADGYACREATIRRVSFGVRWSDADGASTGDEDEPIDYRERDSDDAPERLELMGRVRAAMDRLPDVDREVLAAHYGLDGGGPRSFREIGRERGIHPSNAHYFARRAVRKLARMLGVPDVA